MINIFMPDAGKKTPGIRPGYAGMIDHIPTPDPSKEC
jgi:hypothetical protein